MKLFLELFSSLPLIQEVLVNHLVKLVQEKSVVRCSFVPRSRFLGGRLPEFQRDICKIWGAHQIHLIFTCKIEYSFREISVHFYLNLSLMLIVLAQEGVQITAKLFLHCRSFEFPSKYSISTLK